MTARKGPGRPRHDDLLTPAEWRIAHAVRHGMSNRVIAAGLGVSADAVKFHLGNILGKLGLENRKALKTWTGWPKDSALAGRTREEAKMQLGQIGQISRSVTGIAKAETFYRDVVGLPHLYTFGNLAFFDCGGTRLMLNAGEQKSADTYVIYFRVADIHEAARELGARGAHFISAPHMIHRHDDGTEEWMAFFNDNEGRPLAIMSAIEAA